MHSFIINGGRPLRGNVRINGSKNAALPLMAAALLTTEPVTLHGVPDLSDIRNMKKLLGSLGLVFSEGAALATPAPAQATPQRTDGTGHTTAPSGAKPDPRYAGLTSLLKDRPRITPGGGDGPPPPHADSEPAPGEASGTPARPTPSPTDPHTLTIATHDPDKTLAHYDIVKTMRAGICVLGPLLAARGEARVSLPGGCAIGDRPVDLHLRGLRALGARIELDGGYIVAKPPVSGRLKGTTLFLGGPNGSTVLGTANVLCAAVLAEGTTIIESAACEPEIADLCHLLCKMGARIIGAGTPRLIIDGVDKLHGAEHHVLPDRIEAGTYVMAAAITGGDVTLSNFPTDTLLATTDRLHEMGITLEQVESHKPAALQGAAATGNAAGYPGSDSQDLANTALNRDTVRVITPRNFSAVQVVTQPHPGFPTDLQAQLMALMTLADGNSIVTEKIFPDRFLHVAELSRMGADITRVGNSAVVTGTRTLHGAPVMASDLRASAGLVIAGLAARGTTTINRVYHLDRGYQSMETNLQNLGADIERVDDKTV
ncbi:MAG: UDP-N-acetylglucosamine 1-carboxyvinyltransferase [Phycisphaerales bacterium JB063]